MLRKILIKKKVRNIALMIASQLVLTVFVGYWLNAQYENEKNTLQHDLDKLWRTSVSENRIRKIYHTILQPVIQNTDTLQPEKIKFTEVQIDTLHKAQLISDLSSYINNNQEGIENLINYINKKAPYPETDESIELTTNAIHRILYKHGVRFSYYPYTFENENYSLFKSIFETQLEYNNINLTINYIPLDTAIMPTKQGLYIRRFNNQTRQYEQAAVFNNYSIHLLKIISPQIIFVIILLSLSAFALISTYRGYVKQMNLNLLRSDFINNITHELKIPVATAKIAVEALRKFGLQADAKTMDEYLDMVAREMNRLDQLTERVLKHSVLEKGNQSLKLEETELNTYLKDIIDSANVLNSSNKVDIQYSCPDNPVRCKIDQLYTEGIIKNLIDNSIKYSAPNVHIHIDLSEDSRHAIIEVRDNGPGIKKEYMDKVFDKFFRVPDGDKHNVKGFGLGLSFVALLMRQHKGSISVRNLTEGGCVFTLKFPKEIEY